MAALWTVFRCRFRALQARAEVGTTKLVSFVVGIFVYDIKPPTSKQHDNGRSLRYRERGGRSTCFRRRGGISVPGEPSYLAICAAPPTCRSGFCGDYVCKEARRRLELKRCEILVQQWAPPGRGMYAPWMEWLLMLTVVQQQCTAAAAHSVQRITISVDCVLASYKVAIVLL